MQMALRFSHYSTVIRLPRARSDRVGRQHYSGDAFRRDLKMRHAADVELTATFATVAEVPLRRSPHRRAAWPAPQALRVRVSYCVASRRSRL
jgi:hypothetical protein